MVVLEVLVVDVVLVAQAELALAPCVVVLIVTAVHEVLGTVVLVGGGVGVAVEGVVFGVVGLAACFCGRVGISFGVEYSRALTHSLLWN